MSLREKILIFSWQSIVIFDNGLLRSARNDDNSKKKDVYCLIDFRSTALQTKNNDFLFYRFFKIFSFLSYPNFVIGYLLKNIVVIPLKDKKEKY